MWICCGLAAAVVWTIWSVMPVETRPPQATKPTEVLAPGLLCVLFGPFAFLCISLTALLAAIAAVLLRVGKLLDDSYAQWRANPPSEYRVDP